MKVKSLWNWLVKFTDSTLHAVVLVIVLGLILQAVVWAAFPQLDLLPTILSAIGVGLIIAERIKL
jgi:branched-subunit amino acid ABC-type transport system permease component